MKARINPSGKAVVFVKCQNNRDSSWQTITIFVWLLGRYEPSPPATKELLGYSIRGLFISWKSLIFRLFLSESKFYPKLRSIFSDSGSRSRGSSLQSFGHSVLEDRYPVLRLRRHRQRHCRRRDVGWRHTTPQNCGHVEVTFKAYLYSTMQSAILR